MTSVYWQGNLCKIIALFHWYGQMNRTTTSRTQSSLCGHFVRASCKSTRTISNSCMAKSSRESCRTKRTRNSGPASHATVRSRRYMTSAVGRCNLLTPSNLKSKKRLKKRLSSRSQIECLLFLSEYLTHKISQQNSLNISIMVKGISGGRND